jgi:Ca2+-binding RTX toxin-like protein
MSRTLQIRRPFQLERLELRDQMAAEVTLSNGTLTVTGTDQDDIIAIVSSSSRQSTGLYLSTIQATVRSAETGAILAQRSVLQGSVNQIRVHCLYGDDVAENNTSKPSFMYGGHGSDMLYGGSSYDALYSSLGFGGADEAWGSTMNHLYGRGGDDTLIGADGYDELRGGPGADYLYGFKGNDDLVGDTGDDWLYGGEGDDEMWGGDGRDQMFGELGQDSMQGGIGNDFLDGGYGNDHLSGDDGNDTLHGSYGDDYLHAGDGSDILWGGEGWDEMWGDNFTNSTDTFYFDLLDSMDGHWGSIEWTFSPNVVEGTYKGYKVFTN